MKVQKSDREKKKVLRKQSMEENSIICGVKNPSSLKCVFYELEGGEVGTEFIAERFQEGHENMMHGGFIAAILDEVMGRSINNIEGGEPDPFVTAEMTVNYLQPIAVGLQMYSYGRVVRSEGRRCYATGEIINDEGVIMAKGQAVYVRVEQVGTVDPEDYEGLGIEALGPEDPKMF